MVLLLKTNSSSLPITKKRIKSYPTAYNVGDGSDFTLEETQRVLDILKQKTNGTYNANFDPKDIYTRSDKVGTKIDWNINDRNKFTARYSFVGAQRYNFSRSYSKLSASDVAFVFTNKTHSLTAELNSRIGDNMNNEARFSYVRVRDNREPQGDIFPAITVKKGASSMFWVRNTLLVQIVWIRTFLHYQITSLYC